MNTLPEGLTYKEDIISPEEEKILLEYINLQEWQISLKRKVQHYGYIYDYATRNIYKENALEIPKLFLDLSKKLGIEEPNQIIVNQYKPGEGIASHKDSNIFGDQIASLSLLSPIQMDFKYRNNEISIYLQPRSLLILEKAARYDWSHGITARKSDYVDNRLKKRSTRISITFRSVKKIN